jgi:hypothetical protein
MNYIKLIALLLISSLIYFIYLFIPNTLIVSGTLETKQVQNTVLRGFMQLENWDKWIAQKRIDSNSYTLGSGILKIKSSFVSNVFCDYIIKDKAIPVTFTVEGKGKDSSKIDFQLSFDNKSFLPWQRVANYFLAQSINTELTDLINKARAYYTPTIGNYGFEIKEEKIKDSILVSTEKYYTDTPTIAQVYGMLDQLKQYVVSKKGVLHGDPMVYIARDAKRVYLQVAYLLEKEIPTTLLFDVRKIKVKNLVAINVKGNAQLAYKAKYEAENYIHDQSKFAPIMPYIIYNTNRLIEKDSSKWISTIFYPIF